MSEPGEEDGRFAPLPLTPELRRSLNLRPDETLRVFASGSRTILLERMGLTPSLPLPVGRDLVLVADVHTFPLADVLGLVHASGNSGLLFFSHRDHAKSVYLHHGEVVFASSNQRVDRLGECLVRAGVITFEQLREAERRFTPPDRFGKVLVERSFLTARELWNGVKYQVEEIVRSLFSYTSGTVYFWDGEVQPDNVVRLSLPTQRLVSEGIQRRDELLRFLSLLEDPRVRIEPISGRETSLAQPERRLFEILGTESSFPAVWKKLGQDALSTARTLQLLRLAGAVRVQRKREGSQYLGEFDLHEHDEEAVRRCVTDHVKLLEELAAPLVAVAGAEPLRERLSQVLGELSERHAALLRGLHPSRCASLDPEELTRRALRIPDNREGQVRAALGELVAYLEFELKNHPHIDAPDHLLADLEPLRARLQL
jgi:hypothetical protein